MPASFPEIHAALTAPGQLFEVATEEIRGISTQVWKSAAPSLPAILLASRAHADRTFLVYAEERLSFEDHFRRAAAFAHRLIEDHGIRKGDRVAIAMRNFPEWSIAFWGASAAGAVVAPLNSWGTGPELAFTLEDSGARVLVADAERIERITPHLGDLALEAVVAARCEEPPASSLRLEDLIGDPPSELTLPEIPLEPEDDATLFYTSGTTGRPKGAIGTHRNICSAVVSMAFSQLRGMMRSGLPLPEPGKATEPPSYLLSAPFFHVVGCHGVLVNMAAFGGKIVLMHRWDPDRALELIESEKITSIGGVPAMIAQLMDSPHFSDHDTSSMAMIGYGGAPAPPELLHRIEKYFPDVTASNGYGLTETSSIVTLNVGPDYAARPESVGPAIPICETKVVDSEGKELPPGELGELWLRGSNVVRGYWNRPDATAEDFTNGWFHTGDLARIEEDGFITIVDRIKDMVIRGGENVYCAEVEAALFEHADVQDAAVIGIPPATLGEEVGAVV
ncbi:MAG: acyl--CoA ligase, partial [Deltaproteobacteria bacterium]|nr:acyl--CoA ligase [Deltaproteobacteria bacterium]